jgi:hypothetical protein
MMPALERSFQTGITCLLLLAFAGEGRAQTPLQAHLEPEQRDWVLGVPVEFTASVTNVSSAPVQTYSDLGPKWVGISFFISEDGSTFHGFDGPEWDSGRTMDIMPGTITLNPGAKVQASFSLLWNGPTDPKGQAPTDGFAFPHVGTYFVKVRASSRFGDLMSNVVRLMIWQPRGDDAAIWETLKADKELARYYGFPNGAAGQGEKIQQLLSEYPHSSHTASMKRVLVVYVRQKAEVEQANKARSTSQQQH